MRSTPHQQPPLWPPAAWLHPKAVASSTPWLGDTAEATAVPRAVPEPGGRRSRKGNERSKCWEGQREPAQPSSSDKGAVKGRQSEREMPGIISDGRMPLKGTRISRVSRLTYLKLA